MSKGSKVKNSLACDYTRKRGMDWNVDSFKGFQTQKEFQVSIVGYAASLKVLLRVFVCTCFWRMK